MPTNNKNIFTKVAGENLDLEVEFSIHGKYIPATYYEPEEFPDINIEKMIEAETGRQIFESMLSPDELSVLNQKLFEAMED